MGERPVTIRTARPAAPRVPAARRRRSIAAHRGGARSVSDREGRASARSRSCTSSTRCSATAAAASASRTPRSTRCRSRAIFEAARAGRSHEGVDVAARDHDPARRHAERARAPDGDRASRSRAERVSARRARTVAYLIGTMIEVPRAALHAPTRSPRSAEFFSFGTNDLTQMTFGFSRDDAGEVPARLPRATASCPRTRSRRSTRRRRRARRDRHASAAASVEAEAQGRRLRRARRRPARRSTSSTSVGLDYVSCSPFRVPIARLAAAQAALAEQSVGVSSTA